jgi:hypothetical protein
LNWTPSDDVLNFQKGKLSEYYCYSTGVVCGSLVIFLQVNEFLKKQTYLSEGFPIKIEQLNGAEAFQLLESNIHRAFLNDESLETLLQMLEMIKGLSSGVEHWKTPANQPQVYFYIRNWLYGRQPPPRCQAFLDDARLQR